MQTLVLWILKHTFERFSRWWQRTICVEQDCFWWGRMCAYGAGALPAAAVFWLVFFVVGPQFLSLATALMVLTASALFGLSFAAIVEDQERKTHDMHVQKCVNPAKNSFLDIYIVFLCFCLLCVSTVLVVVFFSVPALSLLLVGVISFSMFPPFIMCDPIPHTGDRARLQKFLTRMRETPPRLAEAEEEA